MANEVMASIQLKQEQELAAHLESIESAKWNIYQDFKFAYEVNIEFHDLELHLTKLAQELKQETAK